MHNSSMASMQRFVDRYLNKDLPLTIIDIGSRDVDRCGKTYRSVMGNGCWKYHGLDLCEGLNVDIVSADPYSYPVEEGSYDVVVSGQVLEHVQDMYKWIRELARIAKPGGLVCVIAPWSWNYHPHPVDCWRIMRDGMRFLLGEIAGLEVLEAYESGEDCIGIARKKG